MPDRGDWLVDQLPLSMVADPFLVGFVRIFQDTADTYLEQVDGFEHVIDPTVAPLAMVQEMGRWLGVPNIHDTMPPDTQRRSVREYGDGLGRRGTQHGLRSLIEMLTGEVVHIEESGGVFGPSDEVPDNTHHVAISIEDTGTLVASDHNDLLERVRDEIPANITFELHVGTKTLWPVAPVAIAS